MEKLRDFKHPILRLSDEQLRALAPDLVEAAKRAYYQLHDNDICGVYLNLTNERRNMLTSTKVQLRDLLQRIGEIK